ncbi:tyrosine-type recombinase/integrase [Streptomyces sp. NPDC051913]|uniref:tyrosine-type recombinase/integrase n=1 Tax=Streptomyces sp. NPDC051913 TaxID=3365676 RepID=UPI0037D4D7C5
MTLAALHSAPAEADDPAAFLWRLVPSEFLAEIGWDAQRQVLAMPMDHPLLGWTPCKTADCGSPTRARTSLCQSCEHSLAASGQDQDAFLAAHKRNRRFGVDRCAAGCPRPWKSSRVPLCEAHLHQQRFIHKVSVEEFLARPTVAPLPGFGQCKVLACDRFRAGRQHGFCKAHRARWRQDLRADSSLDEETWCRLQSPVPVLNNITLRGLSPLASAQIVHGVYERCRQGLKTPLNELRPLVNELRRQQSASVDDLNTERGQRARCLLESFQRVHRRAMSSPASEFLKDTWDLHVFGHSGWLRFGQITQPWLRQAAKRWAVDDLPRRRGSVGATVQCHIAYMAKLSESLRLQNAAQGLDIVTLGRDDIVQFTNRLAYLESRNDLTARLRRETCRHVRRMLTRMRVLGLTRAGEPLEGLAPDFALREEDIPREAERGDEPGRALPLEVVRILCDALPLLGSMASRDFRVAIELLIDTGRRPDEICQLAWDCLRQDKEGGWVLIYDNIKEQRLGRELPITAATAKIIQEQQQAARERFPNTAAQQLKLLARTLRNHFGLHGLSNETLTTKHRDWVDILPPLIMSNGREFPKQDVIPYSHRHTYAQRHADAGVPIDVLSELMDHDSLRVTQTYYRVGEARRRAAVDQVARHQLDRHGAPVWREVETLIDGQRARYARHAIGKVAVPFGGCTEPSNVQAGGGACPFRWQCGGCDHFRTDPSYLPELKAYLDDLRRTKERVLSATGLDEWAREKAIPSEQEIERIKNLISRAEDHLDHLSEAERSELEEAIALVRRGRRAVPLGMPQVRPPTSDLRLERP